VTRGGYVEVQSTPYAYDQGGEAEKDGAKRATLHRFSRPQIRGVAGSGGTGIDCRFLHLVYGSVKRIDPAKRI